MFVFNSVIIEVVLDVQSECAKVIARHASWVHKSSKWMHVLALNDGGWHLNCGHTVTRTARVIRNVNALVVVTSDHLAVVSWNQLG